VKPDYVNNWHRVWSNRRSPEELQGSVLQRLVSIDGFDSPLGMMSEDHWSDYVAMFASRSGIRQGDSVFEIGCGAGAFLYPFYTAGYEVSGIDYSHELIQIARSVMPQRKQFLNSTEARSCPVSPLQDVVVANHVIHYFPSHAYSRAVLERVLQKALRVAALSGIPDVRLRDESESERRALLSSGEYDSKYRGLEILYYAQDWFVGMAQERGFVAQFFDHEMPGFAQNRFRFDCVMTRTEYEPRAIQEVQSCDDVPKCEPVS
jgi:SAM-dependent methyltransferase